jgi:hypothetical protein
MQNKKIILKASREKCKVIYKGKEDIEGCISNPERK